MELIKEQLDRFGTKMDLWFEEKQEIGFGTSLRVRIEETLCSVRSEYQRIAVLQTARLGRMLVIDGIIMLTEFDEHSYHEMIVHVPLVRHPKPEKVLIIGGGDGGCVREVLKHPSVREVHLCEIDAKVVEVCREYLPSVASKLDDPRVSVHFSDGAEFVKGHPETFDVILVDSTDPFGPGEVLFKEPFYRSVYFSLKDDGIVSSQCESFFYHHGVIEHTFSFLTKVFPITSYYYCLVPTYPSGVIGFAFGSKKYHPMDGLDEERIRSLAPLRYYSPEVHRAAFVLPAFASGIIP